MNDSDLGFHLRCGQWILEHRAFPSVDTYTTTTQGQPFLDIHWFYQVCLYSLFHLGGYPWVCLFHVLLTLGAFFFTYQRLQTIKIPPGLCAPLLLAAGLACEIRFRARPEIPSLFFLCLVLWILEERAGRKRDLLFLLPFIQILWVNFEGLFILGWAAMGIYNLSYLIHYRRWDLKLLRYSLGAVGVSLLNPYFVQGTLFPLSNLQTLSNPLMRSSIKELHSPWFSSPHLLSAPTLYLLIYKLFFFSLLILLLATFRKRKWHEILLTAVFGGLSITAVRNIPLLMLPCLPVMAACLTDLDWSWAFKFHGGIKFKTLAPWIFLAVIFALDLRVLTGAFYLAERRTERSGLGLDERALPIRACDFLVQNRLEGKILNQLDDGGWLEFKVPQQVFTDCRLTFFTPYMSSMDPGGLEKLMEQYRPDILFFNCHNDSWVFQLRALTDWRPVYLDEVSVIYLRRGYADSIPSLDYGKLAAGAGVSSGILAEIPVLLGAPPPSAVKNFLGDFYRKPEFPSDILNLGIFCGNNGHPETAELFFWEAVRRSQGRFYDCFYDLGLLYYYGGRRAEAASCMKRVLKDQPDDPAALRIAEMAPP